MITTDSALVWRKSQRCDSSTCVEMAETAAGVALRDSTQPDGPALRFSAADWSSFMTDLRAGTVGTS